MAKVKTLRNPSGTVELQCIYCPACEGHHGLDKRWTFNGDMEKPTFSPSLLVHESRSGIQPRCHSFITDGKIQYLDDCTHKLAGQTIELPDIED